jgi:hypothetical protein
MTCQCLAISVIDSVAKLHQYLKNFSAETQLRLVAATSHMKTYGMIDILYDECTDSVIFVPYDILQSYKESEKKYETEDIEQLAIRAAEKETGLIAKNPQALGSPIISPNSNPAVPTSIFLKFIMLFTEFNGELLTSEEVSPGKIGPPIRVCRRLMKYIFEERNQPLINGIRKEHPHHEAYLRFVEYYEMKYQRKF